MEEIFHNYKNFLLDSRKSVSSVKNSLPHIRAFLLSTKVSYPTEVTTQMVTDYFAHMQSTCSQSKLCQMSWALKAFFKWGRVKLEFPKQKRPLRKIKRPITENELENVIEPTLGNLFPGYSLHIKTILCFLYYTGLDKSKLVYIKRSDFSLDGRELILTLPKRNVRRIPLADRLVRLLKLYFMTEGEEKNALNTNGGKIDRIFRKLKEDKTLGENRAISPEVFTNSFACNCIEKGISLWTLQQLMGHKDVKTTVGYLKLMSNETKKDYLKKINGF